MTFLLPSTLCLRKLPNVPWSICRGLCKQFGMEFAENWYEQLKYRSKLQAVKDLKLTKLHTTQTLNFLTRHVHVQVQNTYCSNHCIVCLCKTNSDTITYCYSVKPIMYCRKETTKFFQERRVSSQTQEKS